MLIFVDGKSRLLATDSKGVNIRDYNSWCKTLKTFRHKRLLNRNNLT